LKKSQKLLKTENKFTLYNSIVILYYKSGHHKTSKYKDLQRHYVTYNG